MSPSLKLFTLKLESAWWMSRPITRTPLIFAAIGYLSVNSSPNIHLLYLLISIFIASCVSIMLNDYFDRETDKITASYLVLPSGLLTVNEAVISIAYGIFFVIIFLALSSYSYTGLFINIILLLLTGLIVYLYSLIKHTGFPASFLVSLPSAIAVLLGSLAANSGELNKYVIAYSLLYGFASNILAAFRDVDKDPEAGNLTVPVRIGMVNSFFIVAICSLINFILVVYLITQSSTANLFSLTILIASLLCSLFSLPSLILSLKIKDRGRIARIKDFSLWSTGRYWLSIAMLCAFSWPIGLGLAIPLEILSFLCRKGYKNRLVSGGLKQNFSVLSTHD